MKSIKLGFKKYLKGMFGIVLIKLCIIAVIMVNQACETEESIPQENAKENFLEALKVSSDRLANIKTNKEQIRLGNLNMTEMENFGVIEDVGDVTNICTKEALHTDGPGDDNDESITLVLSDFISIEVIPKDQYEGDETEHCYTFNNDEVDEALEPLTSASSEYFKSKGLTDADILEILDGEDESYLIPIVMEVTRYEDNSYAKQIF